MKNLLKRSLPSIATAWLLAACSISYAPQNRPVLPENNAVWLQVEELDTAGNVLQTSLLSVQGMANGNTRWLQTDALGAPKARLIASENGWQNDGFAPPNRRAQKLFIQLFPLLSSRLDAPQDIIADETTWRVRRIEMLEE